MDGEDAVAEADRPERKRGQFAPQHPDSPNGRGKYVFWEQRHAPQVVAVACQ